MSVGSSLGEFYADDGLIGSRDPECLQGVINTLIVLFPRVVLMFNVEKSKTMKFQIGLICTGMAEEAFSQSITGYGYT